MGLEGVEPSTLRLSGVRSNRSWAIGPKYSYIICNYQKNKSVLWKVNSAIHPNDLNMVFENIQCLLLRKEVIQPHLPIRLPCYDFILFTKHTFATFLLKKVETVSSGAPNSDDVTGGVYKTRERIHGAVADTPLLAIPTSRSRVADYDPNWGLLWGFAPLRSIASLCIDHCSTCVALGVRAIMTWRHPHLPHS